MVAFVAVVLVGAYGVAVIALPRSGHVKMARSGVVGHHAARVGLPVAAEGPLSRILARDDPSYRAVATANGLVLRNRVQGLRAWFGRRAVVVRAGGSWLGLRLAAYGYGGRLRAAGAALPRAQANRVVYRRGGLAEWYANVPLGLEQGFTVASRPAGGAAGGLALSLALSGDLRASLRSGAVIFSGRGVSLAYQGLVASDARGRQLPARIELRGDRLLLRIDDRGARYPLRVDPTFVERARLTGAQALDENAFAVDGNTIAVGSFRKVDRPDGDPGFFEGVVYVFVRPAGGWAGAQSPQAELRLPGTGALAVTGRPVMEATTPPSGVVPTTVAFSGDTVLALTGEGTQFEEYVASNRLGIRGHHVPGGAVYAFVRPAGGWNGVQTPQGKLTAPDRGGHIRSMATAGSSTVMAGAPDAPGGGAVYVFLRPAGGWNGDPTPQGKLIASDGGGDLGRSVAMSGSLMVVAGAPGAPGGGAVYLFVYPFFSPTGWRGDHIEQAKLTASDGGGELGLSVAISGNTVVAGAPYSNGEKYREKGGAYVWVRPAGGWHGVLAQQAKLTTINCHNFGPEGGGDIPFVVCPDTGRSVSVQGDTIMVRTPRAIPIWKANRGYGCAASCALIGWRQAVYVFLRPAGGWHGDLTPRESLTGGGPTVFGDTVVIGSDGGLTVFAQLAFTTTAMSCSPDNVVVGHPSKCTVTVTDDQPTGATTPTGKVSFATRSCPSCSQSGGPGLSPSECTLSGTGASASCSVIYTPESLAVPCVVCTNQERGLHTVTAAYGGDPTHGTSGAWMRVTVRQNPTETRVGCSPERVAVGEPSTCTATVTDNTTSPSTPTGAVEFASTGEGSFSASSCALSGIRGSPRQRCAVTYTPDAVGTGSRTITATYRGDAAHTGGSHSAALTVTERSTSTRVGCSPDAVAVGQPATCSATVADTARGTPRTPAGAVHFASSGAGTFSDHSCTLADAGPGEARCAVTYTSGPPGAATRAEEIKATYTSESPHTLGSTGTTALTVNERSTSTSVSCSPNRVAVGQPADCSATVTDIAGDAVSAPTGTVHFASSGAGSFSADRCSLTHAGPGEARCSVTYTSGPPGAPTRAETITASYSSAFPHTHAGSTGRGALTVNERSTSTSLSCSPDRVAVGQPADCSATVTDTAGDAVSTPTGAVHFTSSGAGSFSADRCSLTHTRPGVARCSVTYTSGPPGAPTRAETITASYSSGSPHTHAGSTDNTTLTVDQRATATSVSCSPDRVAVGQPSTCSATVTDTAGEHASTPAGTIEFASNGAGSFHDHRCTLAGTGAAASCAVTYAPGSVGTGSHTITATFNGDATHAGSAGNTNLHVTPSPPRTSPPGTSPPGTSPPRTSPPRCTIKPDARVSAAVRGKARLKGVLKVSLRCDQTARVSLRGSIVAILQVKSGKRTRKTFRIAAVRVSITGGKARSLTVRLPKAAIQALKAHAREAVTFTLLATNSNGSRTSTAKIKQLRLAR
jgi:Bacterial Ig-like domain (group 3)/FG-GAP repeat